MRVTHVAPTVFAPEGLLGGGERYPLELARALARHTDTELLVPGPEPGSTVETGGLRVRSVRPLAYAHGHPSQPISPALVGALRAADLVHAHQMRSAPSRLAAVVTKARGRRVVVTDHGLGGGGWVGLLPRLFDAFLPVSRFSAETLRCPPHRTRIIYGGADPRRFHPQPGAERSFILFVGRLTPHKGIDVLIRALPEGARLLVAGSSGHDPRPPERDYPALLRTLARDKQVEFLGAVSDEDLPELYRRAAVLALPSVERTWYGRTIPISELLGLSLLEAMASGTPVVCSRIGGLPEVVREGETGFAVVPGDIAELHDRLRCLLSDPRRASRMGAAARELVLLRYTWEHCALRCLEAYDAVLRHEDLGPSAHASRLE